MGRPACFISYSWDHEEHRAWVRRLAEDLQRNGVDTGLDQQQVAGSSFTQFMEAAVRDSDYVLIICTPQYRKKADNRIGGVGYESQIVSAEVYHDSTSLKFIPILRSGTEKTALPTYLQGRIALDFRIAEKYDAGLSELLKRMWVKTSRKGRGRAAKLPEAAGPIGRRETPAGSVASRGTPPGRVQSVTDATFAEVVEAEEKIPVLVEFWAEWCGPCRMVGPVLEEIAQEYQGKIKIVRLNIDEEPTRTQRYQIMAIPTLNVFDRGEVALQIMGAKPKSAIVQSLTPFLERPDEEEEGQDQVEDSLALTLSQGRIRLVRVRSDGTYSFVDSEEDVHGLLYLRKAAGGSFARKVQEFEELINDSYSSKDDLITFLEENPTFLLGGDYKSARSRIFLTQENRAPLTPDFFLQPVSGELCDILEVQPPQHEIAVSIGGVSMISEVVLEAVSRLSAYRDYFEDDRRRVSIEDEHGVRVFRPRLFVIIGRSGRTDPLTMRKLEGTMGNISLRTWDEILAVAKRRAEL